MFSPLAPSLHEGVRPSFCEAPGGGPSWLEQGMRCRKGRLGRPDVRAPPTLLGWRLAVGELRRGVSSAERAGPLYAPHRPPFLSKVTVDVFRSPPFILRDGRVIVRLGNTVATCPGRRLSGEGRWAGEAVAFPARAAHRGRVLVPGTVQMPPHRGPSLVRPGRAEAAWRTGQGTREIASRSGLCVCGLRRRIVAAACRVSLRPWGVAGAAGLQG